MNRSKRYRTVGLGGTFDHFHQGHSWFLQQAAALSEELIVGVSTERLLTTKSFPESIENYEKRVATVASFLEEHHIKHQIVALSDVAGPTLTDSRIEAVILTEDTKKGGTYINEQRARKGMPLLPIEIIPLYSGSVATIISSQSIRSGQYNRVGAGYSTVFGETLVLSDTQREEMRVIQGELVEAAYPTDLTRYLVGDSTLRRFQIENQKYDMAIIDGKEQRKTYYPLVIDQSAIDLIVVNPPGSITTMLAHGLKLALRQKLTHIFVDGEEDLAAVVLQLLLPLGACIYYGQPETGLVRWQVTEKSKERTALLLDPHFQTNPKLVE